MPCPLCDGAGQSVRGFSERVDLLHAPKNSTGTMDVIPWMHALNGTPRTGRCVGHGVQRGTAGRTIATPVASDGSDIDLSTHPVTAVRSDTK
jgi:hypothetical protein